MDRVVRSNCVRRYAFMRSACVFGRQVADLAALFAPWLRPTLDGSSPLRCIGCVCRQGIVAAGLEPLHDTIRRILSGSADALDADRICSQDWLMAVAN